MNMHARFQECDYEPTADQNEALEKIAQTIADDGFIEFDFNGSTWVQASDGSSHDVEVHHSDFTLSQITTAVLEILKREGGREFERQILTAAIHGLEAVK